MMMCLLLCLLSLQIIFFSKKRRGVVGRTTTTVGKIARPFVTLNGSYSPYSRSILTSSVPKSSLAERLRQRHGTHSVSTDAKRQDPPTGHAHKSHLTLSDTPTTKLSAHSTITIALPMPVIPPLREGPFYLPSQYHRYQ